MGAKCASSYANIFMGMFEKNYIPELRKSHAYSCATLATYFSFGQEQTNNEKAFLKK